MSQENKSSRWDDAQKKVTKTIKLSTVIWDVKRVNKQNGKKILFKLKKKKYIKKWLCFPQMIQWVYPIQESCLWLAGNGEIRKQRFFRLTGTSRGSQAKDYAKSQGAFWINQQFLLCWRSGGFLGSVVLYSAAGSLLRWGEVLCLAELSGHTRHIGSARVNTETLQREKQQQTTKKKGSNQAGNLEMAI